MKDKLITEALEQIGYRSDDYLHIAEKFHPGTFEFYMNLAYAIGYEYGKQESKQNWQLSVKKPVISKDIFGNKTAEFESIQEAAEVMNVNESSIRRAALKKTMSCGFFWEFI